uniref:phage tail spike protein n=1 Tax=Eremococcus coleocola TaxID=88132 RepID=UPI0006859AF3
MKPILFGAEEKTFLTYGFGEINATKAIARRERNGEYSLYIEYPAHGEMANLFKKEMKIKADAGVLTKNQTFEITRINRDSKNVIKIYANHISGKLEYMTLSQTLKADSINAEGALRLAIANSTGDTEFDVWSDIQTTGNVTWDITKVENIRKVLGGMAGSILDVFGGEYEFDNQRIRLHKQLGRKVPTVLEYGRNIVSAEEDEDITGAYTSVMPFASYTPQQEASENSEVVSDKKQETVTVILPEKIIDSEFVEIYASRRIKMVDLSNKFGEKEVPTVEKLRQHAETYVKNNKIGAPKINTKIEYIDLATTVDYKDLAILEEIELCDIVPVYYPKIGITNNDAKVVVVEYNCLLDRNESIELGMVGKSFASTVNKDLQERLDNIESETKKAVNNLVPYLMNGFGNRIWYEEPDPNMEHKIDDTWFEKNGNFYRIKKWDGEKWANVLDTETFERELQAKVDQAQAEMAQAREDLKKRMTEIDEQLKTIDIDSIINQLEEAGLSKKEIDEIKASIPNFDDLKSEIEAVRETSKVNAEMIGNDGITRYNKNLLIGEFDRKLEMRDLDGIEVMANDGGFKAGETYTISFEAICGIVQKVLVKFGYNLSVVEDVLYQLVPDFEKFPEV